MADHDTDATQRSLGMSIQTVTRQALLKKIADVVKNMPDDQLQQTWEEVDSWDTVALDRSTVDYKANQNSADDQEIVEFTITSRQGATEQFVRFPVRSNRLALHAIMEVSDTAYDSHAFTQRLQANIGWWNQNCDKICSDPSLYDRYVAISDGAVFSAESYLDAYNKSLELHTDGWPYIFFLKSPSQPANHEN